MRRTTLQRHPEHPDEFSEVASFGLYRLAAPYLGGDLGQPPVVLSSIVATVLEECQQPPDDPEIVVGQQRLPWVAPRPAGRYARSVADLVADYLSSLTS